MSIDSLSLAYAAHARQAADQPGVYLLEDYPAITAILNDSSRFARYPPVLAHASRNDLPLWIVFRNDPRSRAIRATLARRLAMVMSEALESRVRADIARMAERAIAMGEVDPSTAFGTPIMLAVAEHFFGLHDRQIGQLADTAAIVDSALWGAASENELDEALATLAAVVAEHEPLRTTWLDDTIWPDHVAPREREANVAMLIFGLFGPLTAAMSSLIVAAAATDVLFRPADAYAWTEENARLFSPTVAIDRVLTAPAVRVGDRKLHQGDRVRCLIARANHDASIFKSPHAYRPDRDNARAHLAFGVGPHACIARLLTAELGKILLQEIYTRVQGIHHKAEPTSWAGPLNAFAPRGASVTLNSRLRE